MPTTARCCVHLLRTGLSIRSTAYRRRRATPDQAAPAAAATPALLPSRANRPTGSGGVARARDTYPDLQNHAVSVQRGTVQCRGAKAGSRISKIMRQTGSGARQHQPKILLTSLQPKISRKQINNQRYALRPYGLQAPPATGYASLKACAAAPCCPTPSPQVPMLLSSSDPPSCTCCCPAQQPTGRGARKAMSN
jgi:hypothetical protein